MKIWALMILILVAVVVVLAQSPGSFTLSPQGALASCPTPAAGSNIQCSTTTGWMFSDNGGAYYSPKTSAPTLTTISCPTASLTAGGTGTFTASGCTIH